MERSSASLVGAQADVELGSEHLIDDTETEDQRASLLHAAAHTQNVATLTGTHGVVAMPLDKPTVRWPTPASVAGKSAWDERTDELPMTALLRARMASLKDSDDSVARARAALEVALAKIEEGDLGGAREAAMDALSAEGHSTTARALLVGLVDRRADLDAQLDHVERLVRHVEGTTARTDYLVEKARLLEAKSGPSEASAEAYAEALSLVIDHAGALEGLEGALASLGRWDELATHFGRLAGLARARESTAWFLAERASVLERRLGDVASSRALLERAVELDPRRGAVRTLAVDHAVRDRDDARLSVLLEGEAALEAEPTRAVGLLLDAARASLRGTSDGPRAIELLERAYQRGPTTPWLDRRVAEELATQRELHGAYADAVKIRKALVPMAFDARDEASLLRALAESAEAAGLFDEAIGAWERARESVPSDPSFLEELDRLLVRAGRHDARAVAWVRESARVSEPGRKARALVRAAESFRAAGREGEAQKQLQSAWMMAPGLPGTVEALVDRVPAMGRAADVTERVRLYERAASVAEPAKKVHYLEKIAWIWDDVVGDPRRASEAYEEILSIEPGRVTAVLGLASTAARAGDAVRLARAFLDEVALTKEADARAELRLAAAEALSTVDPERSLALAGELTSVDCVARRAGELVTRLHAASGRWELAQASLAARAKLEEGAERTALIVARAALLRKRLAAPGRALEALEELRKEAATDASVARARFDALTELNDDDALVAEYERLAEEGPPALRLPRLLAAAEIEESREGRDEEAVRLYLAAFSAGPDDILVRDRLVRLGARAAVPDSHVPVTIRALRWLDTDAPPPEDAGELVAQGSRELATLRIVERMARHAAAHPRLANALALEASLDDAVLARRALHGLRALVTWQLPEADDLHPWAELLRLGTSDVAVLGDLVARARARVRKADEAAIELCIEATLRRIQLSSPTAPTERIVQGLVLARLYGAAGRPREAAERLRTVLTEDATNVTAAAMLSAIASDLGERRWAIEAALALSKVTEEGRERARLLRDAADLAVAERDLDGAAAALDAALASDPEDVLVASRLAQVQLMRGAYAELARALRKGIHAARGAEAIVPMASELAEVARRWLSDPLLAIFALERSREVSPSHMPSLFLLAELYIGQRAWEKALDALSGVVTHAHEPGEKLTGLTARASIYRRALGDPTSAERELRAALAIDPHDRKTLRALLDLGPELPAAERAELLSRFVGFEEEASSRLPALLELADVRRSLGDVQPAEMALVEAAALSPGHAMLERVRGFHTDPEASARLLVRAVSRLREGGAKIDETWLTALAEAELSCGRFEDAKVHLEEAVELAPFATGPRLALARAFSERGRYAPVVDVLVTLVADTRGSLDPAVLRALSDGFARTGRIAEARAIDEVRSTIGDRDPALRAALEGAHGLLHGADGALSSGLRTLVVPGIGGHPFWDVAAIATSLAGKIVRLPLADWGASTKTRIKPRIPHPARQLVDLAARTFDLADVEIALSDEVVAPALAVEDLVWLVVPSGFGTLPPSRAMALLAVPLLRLALGVPWCGMPASPDAFAAVTALGRVVAPSFQSGIEQDLEERVQDMDAKVRRALDRKRRKQLEDLAEALDQSATLSFAEVSLAVAQAEARASFLLSGDLRTAFQALGSFDGPLADALRVARPETLDALAKNPVSRDLIAFALRPETVALRRDLGTL